MKRKQHDLDAYPFIVRPADAEDGGGFLVEFPDIPGCVADGASKEAAIAAGREALEDCLFMLEKMGRPLPVPGAVTAASGKWLQRAPKSLHARLAARAEAEGVSLNTLVTAFIAEGLGRREAR